MSDDESSCMSGATILIVVVIIPAVADIFFTKWIVRITKNNSKYFEGAIAGVSYVVFLIVEIALIVGIYIAISAWKNRNSRTEEGITTISDRNIDTVDLPPSYEEANAHPPSYDEAMKLQEQGVKGVILNPSNLENNNNPSAVLDIKEISISHVVER